MLQPNGRHLLTSSEGSSSVSSSSSAFVNNLGAGASSNATGTFTNGETLNSSQEVFTPEADSSSGSASATASLQETSVKTAVEAPVTTSDLNQTTDTAKKKDADTLGTTGSQQNTMSLETGSGSSYSSSNSTSFVNDTGAGSSSNAFVTSPTGESSSSDTIYTPGATSSSGSASGSASSNTLPITDATASTGNGTDIVTDVVNVVVPTPTPIIPARVLRGTAGRDRLRGGLRDDRIRGNGGNDQVRGRDGNDQVFGGAGRDWISGNGGDDQLAGGAGNDRLQGDQGNDVLQGGSGKDSLVGGFGRDKLTGGEGADLFVLTAESSEPQFADVITDFSSVQGDKLKLVGNVSPQDLVLTEIDSDRNGIQDATLIRGLSGNIFALVLNTVDATGETTLVATDFV